MRYFSTFVATESQRKYFVPDKLNLIYDLRFLSRAILLDIHCVKSLLILPQKDFESKMVKHIDL